MKPNQDVEHLRLLSIFHYVLAALLAVFSMFPLIHVAIGIAIVTGVFDEMDSGEPPPPFFGWFFIVFPGMFILCGMAMAIAVAIAAKRLRRYRSYTFCLIVAGLECMFMPMGTVLGVFTIVVLVRPTVKELFEAPSTG